MFWTKEKVFILLFISVLLILCLVFLYSLFKSKEEIPKSVRIFGVAVTLLFLLILILGFIFALVLGVNT